MKIALLPLDERPVNTRYPQMIAQIAHAEIALPPVAMRGEGRQPADVAACGQWLRSAATDCAGIVASNEFLTYGNLINSRISEESVLACLPRLSVLEEIQACGTPVYAFSLITRIANANDCVEEPLYWKTYGTRFYQLSQQLHKRERGEAVTLDEAEIPARHRTDWLQRRLRNHTVNLALLDMLSRDRLSLLLLTSDDTSPFGLSTREKTYLEGWAQMLGAAVLPKILIHPGADEVGSALVTRMLCQLTGRAPRICPLYAVEGGDEIVAPYEDRAVKLTVAGQIHACGATLVTSSEDADLILAVLPPSPRRTEWRPDFAEAEKAARAGHYRAFFAALASLGKPIALGDVAYPNGADPLAIELLFAPDSPLTPGSLIAYGAWNTAGNTLGTTVAQAVCWWLGGEERDTRAQNRFLTHRFLEDWGYQFAVRREARAANYARFGRNDPSPESPEEIAFTCRSIEMGLQKRLAELQTVGVGVGLTLAPGSVRLPWKRTFEVDFDLAD